MSLGGFTSYDEIANSTIEELQARHKKEKKQLQGKLLQLKKSVSSGDKKRVKEIQTQINEMEKEMSQRHEKELQEFESRTVITPAMDAVNGNEVTPSSLVPEFNSSMHISGDQNASVSQSRAQKRREKRSQAAQSRAQAMEQSSKDYETSTGKLESDAITMLLRSRNLRLHEIRGDGNCLYSAVSHQLDDDDRSSDTNPNALRSRVAKYLLSHRDEYSCFVELDPSDEKASDPFSAYCSRIEGTNAWAGNVEIEALSRDLKRPIEIIQANAEPCFIGKDAATDAKNIVIVYHRYMYGAGGHYNSVEEIQQSTIAALLTNEST